MWLITDGTSGRWQLGIGDPTFLGWFTVFAYALAAYMCASALKVVRGNHEVPRRQEDRATLRRFWLGLTFAMGFLAINKQLDLQTLLTEVARDSAHEEGWYETRRAVQVWFVKLVGVFALTVGTLVTFRMRHLLRYVMRPLLGIVCLLTFVTARAASFHHIDQMLKTEVLGVRTNGWLELSGIALVIWGARRIGGGQPLVNYLVKRLNKSALMRWLPAGVYARVRHAMRWATGQLAAERAEAVEKQYTRQAPRSTPFPRRPVAVPSPPPSVEATVVELQRSQAPREEMHIQVRVREVTDKSDS